MDDRRRYSDSFVVRIWWEEGEETPVWRGWVQHAASGETRYFHRVGDLMAFVEGCTGALVEPEGRREGGCSSALVPHGKSC